jgi:hypothetical protein
VTARCAVKRSFLTYANVMPKSIKPTVPNPNAVARILASAAPGAAGCLISSLTVNDPRPFVWSHGRSVSAIRVIAATALGRTITPDEEVHHRCGKYRCVRAECLEPMAAADHIELHRLRSLERGCVRHGIPWDRINARGHGECRACTRESHRRTYAKHGRAKLTPEQLAKQRAANNARYAANPEVRRKKMERQRARRAQQKAEAA